MNALALVTVALALSTAACGAALRDVGRAPQLSFAAPLDFVYGPCAPDGPPQIVAVNPHIDTSPSSTKSDDGVNVARPGGSFLVVWSEGTVESGYSLRGLAYSPNGMAQGAPFPVSDGTHVALKPLRVTFVDDTHARVLYYSSTKRGFELVATSIVCAAP